VLEERVSRVEGWLEVRGASAVTVSRHGLYRQSKAADVNQMGRDLNVR
jgi:hypothetical protein